MRAKAKVAGAPPAGAVRTRALVLAVSVLGVAFVGGCGVSVAGSQPPVIVKAQQSASPPPSADAPVEEPGTDAVEDFTASLSQNLAALAAESPKPRQEQVRQAFVSSGGDADAVEVSIDTTPTGLEVDAVTGAVKVGGVCIFGHVSEGAATVTDLPVLADGRCFIGDQR